MEEYDRQEVEAMKTPVPQPTDIKHIVRTPGFYGGKPCIDNYKISVHNIAIAHQQGYTPEQIATELFPVLTLAQVYAALLYYYEHQEEIDREIAEEAADIQARSEADHSPLVERFRHERTPSAGRWVRCCAITSTKISKHLLLSNYKREALTF